MTRTEFRTDINEAFYGPTHLYPRENRFPGNSRYLGHTIEWRENPATPWVSMRSADPRRETSILARGARSFVSEACMILSKKGGSTAIGSGGDGEIFLHPWMPTSTAVRQD